MARLDEALSLSRLALELEPKLAFTHFVRGTIFAAKGDYTEAKNAFAAGIQLGFATHDAWIGLAEADRMLGNHETALAGYTKSIEVGGVPRSATWRPYYGRASSRSALLEWREAADDYRLAIKYGTTGGIAPEDLAPIYTDLAWASYELTLDAEMEDATRRALELGPDLFYVAIEIGSLRLYCGKYDEAIRLFDEASRCDSASGLPYLNRGLVHVYLRNLTAALGDLDKAIAINDRDSLAWHTRGWARLCAESWPEAELDLEKAVELGARDAFVFTDRAVARWWLGNKRGALADLGSVIQVRSDAFSPGFVPPRREDAVTWGACQQEWTRAVDESPSDPVPRLGRGLCLWLAGQSEAAHLDLAKAGSLRSKSAEVKGLLSNIK